MNVYATAFEWSSEDTLEVVFLLLPLRGLGAQSQGPSYVKWFPHGAILLAMLFPSSTILLA